MKQNWQERDWPDGGREGSAPRREPGLRDWDPDERHLWRREWDPGNSGGLEREHGPRAAPAPVSFRGMGPKDYTRSDDRIMEDVCERLTDSDQIDARGISVEVEAGRVTLVGSVPSRAAKYAAADLAASAGGVKRVENRLGTAARR